MKVVEGLRKEKINKKNLKLLCKVRHLVKFGNRKY